MGSNSIYEYYSKVSDRFYLARIFQEAGKKKIRHLWQPMARKVILFGYEEFDFFICKEMNCLIMCEGLTGAEVIRQSGFSTRRLRRCKIRQFTGVLANELNRLGGKTFLNQLIINFLVDWDQSISPRWKAKSV